MGPRLGVLFVLLLPGACAQAPGSEAMALADALENSRANLTANSPGGLLPPPPQPPPRPRSQSTRPRPVDEAPGTRPVAAAQLIGAVPEVLRRWLGEPTRRRAEGGAEIWLYAGQDCALDLVLYRDAGALRVAHASARANGAAAQTEGACLRQISATAGGRPVPAAGDPMPVNHREPGA